MAPRRPATSSSAPTQSDSSWRAGCRPKASWATSISAASTAWPRCRAGKTCGPLQGCGRIRAPSQRELGVHRPAAVQRAAHGEMVNELRDTTASIYFVPDVFAFDLIQGRLVEINGMPAHLGLRYARFTAWMPCSSARPTGASPALDCCCSAPLMLADRPRGEAHLAGTGSVPPAPLRPERRGDPGLQVPQHDGHAKTAPVVTQATKADPPRHAARPLSAHDSLG